MGARTIGRRVCTVLSSAVLGLCVVGAFVGLSATPAEAAADTLYVGTPGCSDAGPGTSPSQPFCTIIKAASVAKAGQTVLVASGTYSGGISVVNSGAAAKPITFAAAPGAQVTVSGGTNGFALSGKSYVTVDGFSVTSTTSFGISVKNSSNITISGNTVTYAGHPVKGQIAAGIYLSGDTSSTVTGNTADHNSDSGIYLTGGTTGTTVSNNEASWNAEGYQRNANGINVISPGNTIIRNVLHDNEDSGIQFYTGGNNNQAILNVSYNNGDHGIDDLNVTGGRLTGNTIYHNCTTGINVEGTSGDYVVENNIAVDNAVYPAYNGISCNRRAGNIGIWDSAPSSTTVDHNLVWITPGCCTKTPVMYVFGTSYTSLAAMQAATGQEPHGIQADPRFVGAASGNLQLGATSPAIDAATSAAPGEQSTDILGNPRVDVAGVPNTPDGGPRPYDDIGAYEYQPGSQQPQPPTASLVVTPSSGLAPLPVSADASGSTDPQGEPLTYSFSFGDGTTVGPQSQPAASHTYDAAGSYSVTVTVADTDGASATAAQIVNVTAPAAPTYVSQIATNVSTNVHTSGYVTVWRAAGVAAGDSAVVSVQLTGTAPSGAVAATDSRGNVYTAVNDVADAVGHRLVILYGVVGTALAPNDTINVSFPTAASYRITADELANVGAVDQTAYASGNGATFASGPTATTSVARELVFGAVTLDGGSAPTWASGWTALSSYAVGANDYLGRAYQVSNSTGSFNATGSASGNWLAAVVTFS